MHASPGIDRDTLLHLLDPLEGEEKGYFCCSYGTSHVCRFINVCAICKGEEYGLTADSEPGNGTCIKSVFRLQKEKRRHGVKILILDDEYIILDGLCSFRGRCMDVESSGKRWMGKKEWN